MPVVVQLRNVKKNTISFNYLKRKCSAVKMITGGPSKLLHISSLRKVILCQISILQQQFVPT